MADRRHEHLKIAERVRPRVIRRLAAREEPLTIARDISSDHRVDERLAYRWVLSFEEELRKRWRSFAKWALVLLWMGFVGIVGFVTELLLGPSNPVLRFVLLGVAAISAPVGIILLARSRDIAARVEIQNG
jgi:hypothetical protein